MRDEFPAGAAPDGAVVGKSILPGTSDFPGLGQATLLTLATLAVVAFAEIVFVGVSKALDWDLSAWSEMAGSNVLGFGLVLFWGCRRVGAPLREILRFEAFPAGILLPVLLLVLGSSIVLSEMDNLIRVVLPMPPWILEIFMEMIGGGWPSLVALVVVAPLTEELLFRGLILRGLIAQRGVWSGVLYSSLLFGIMHLNPWQFVSAFLIGMVLGWLFVLSRSLVPCILLHAVFNALTIVVGGYAESFGFSIPGYTGEPSVVPVFQPLVFDLLGIVLVVVSLAWMSRIFASRSRRAWSGD